MRNIIIAGGGPTGSHLAHLLRATPLCASTVVWEKSSSTGRFSAHASRPPGSTSDLGAQYFTANPACASTTAALAELRAAGMLGPPLPRGAIEGLRPPHDAGEHFAGGAAGAAGVVRHWLASAVGGGCTLALNTRLVALDFCGGGGWLARGMAGEGSSGAAPVSAAADAVVLTMPLPQVLAVGGDAGAALAASGVGAALSAAAYSSRAVLVLTFAPESGDWWTSRARWGGHFVGAGEPGGGAVRYVAHSARMRALGGAPPPPPGAPTEFVFHSTTELGERAVAAGGRAGGGAEGHAWRDALRAGALAALAHAMGEALPYAAIGERFHVWRYSQRTAPPGSAGGDSVSFLEAPGSAGSGSVSIVKAPGGAALLLRCGAAGGAPLVIAGDGFTESNLGGCVRSAEAARDLLLAALAAQHQ